VKLNVFEVSSKIQTKEKFTNKEAPRHQQQATVGTGSGTRAVPAYAAGQPLYGDSDDFYMEFAEAYT